MSQSNSKFPPDINAQAIRAKMEQDARDKVVADIRKALDVHAVSVIFTIDKRVQCAISKELEKEFPQLASRVKNSDEFIVVPKTGVTQATEFRIIF